MRTPVENHDLVPSLSQNIENQAHSRVPECDGRPAVQVESGPVDGMVTTSTGVQTDMPTVVHSPRGPVCHSSEPQASTVRVSYPRPQGLGHRCSKHKLDGSYYLCFPSNDSPSQVDPKIRQCHCLIIVIAPGWPGMPWFWDLVQLSTEIPLQLPVLTTLPRQIKFILTMDFHGCPWMSRGTRPWMSVDIHVLLNGIMVKDHGLTDHGQCPWSVKTWSSPWTSQGCPWTLTMVIVNGHPCFVKWHHGQR